MIIRDAIQWHEGMMLAPQHFQQSWHRQEEQLFFHLRKISPYHWGVRRMRFDPALIEQGCIRIAGMEAVMPDGTEIFYPCNDCETLEVDLTTHRDGMRRQPVTIYIALPARSSKGLSSRLRRYRSIEGQPVTDENTGDSEIIIPYLRPKIELLAAPPAADYTAFPLVKVKHECERYFLEDFVPPQLNVARNSVLGSMCSSISLKLREKAQILAGMSAIGVMAADKVKSLEDKIKINCIVSGLPFFEALLNAGTAHPYLLYLGICNIIGRLGFFNDNQVPPVLPAYDHNDLWNIFSTIRDQVLSALDGVNESHTQIPFHYENGEFFLRISGKLIGQPLLLGVKAGPGLPDNEITKWMEEAQIGSGSKMETIVKNRILGAKRRHVTSFGDINAPRNIKLFVVQGDQEIIQANDVLKILNTADPERRRMPSDIILLVQNGAGCTHE